MLFMRNNIKIANFEISENKTFLIAACDNHFGSLTNAKKMITLAKERSGLYKVSTSFS